ncbi:uncharacterized mitochondrial protein AtMg00810-like [Malus domestica]|uniref:uncharacterized mitochondrial protein AtMg00810-like n=1 Tax=Malus domestica TaxID=3750 RepID=UPI0010AAA1F5|nr:uncharacterized protein LOC108173359 [Malus domestica]
MASSSIGHSKCLFTWLLDRGSVHEAACNNAVQMHHLIKKLGTLFSMKDLWPLHYFLGVEVSNFKHQMHLSQTKYALDLLKRTKFVDAKPISTPVPTGKKLSMFAGEPHLDPQTYRSIVGTLQYLTITRPDLSYAMNQSTYDNGLLYKPCSMLLSAFSDADYAGDPDTRHSTGGFCVYLDSNLVSWSSKKQKTVSRSSTEAEYRQLAYTAAELSWLRSLFRDLQGPNRRLVYKRFVFIEVQAFGVQASSCSSSCQLAGDVR